jgi:uncharacterized damage-inducible protein DinB
MSTVNDYAAIVASSLDWEQAHASFDNSLKGLSADLRGKRPDNFPHSVWELVDHIRITNHDLLEYVSNPKYEEKLEWPKDYWPASAQPKNDKEWSGCLDAIHKDVAALKKFTTDNAAKLTDTIPWATHGQTFLRTVLVSMDHTSHHTGQIIAVRRLLGAWPPPK